MYPQVRPSIQDDVTHIAPRLCDTDLKEIVLLSGNDPSRCLEHGLNYSDDPRTIVAADGEPVAMFGVCPYSPGTAIIWLLGTDRLKERRTLMPFMRHCRPWVEDMQSRHAVMFNYIWAGNITNIRWLKWCGFTFKPTAIPSVLLFERHANV